MKNNKSTGRLNREAVLRAYQMYEDEGMTKYEIDLAFNRTGSVYKWLNDPGRFDPYFDEVAIERGLRGDIEVIENMTLFEYSEFLDRLGERMIYWERERKFSDGDADSTGRLLFGKEWDTLRASANARRKRRATRAA